MGRHIQFADASLEEFREDARLHVEALNHALANVPADRVRIHVCWGNYEGPHHYDVRAGRDHRYRVRREANGDLVRGGQPAPRARVGGVRDVKLPAGKVLIPGVLDSTTNYIEHPDFVAQRIVRYARLVGRENVIAGTDCGFGTWVGQARGRSGDRVGEAGGASQRAPSAPQGEFW